MKLMLTCKCGSLDFEHKGNNKYECKACGYTESIYGGEVMGLQRQFATEIEIIPYMSDAEISKLSDTLYEMSAAMDKVQELWPNTDSLGYAKYPFANSLDEVAADVATWVMSFRAELTNLKNRSYIPDVFKEQGVQVGPREEAVNKPESGVKDRPATQSGRFECDVEAASPRPSNPHDDVYYGKKHHVAVTTKKKCIEPEDTEEVDE